MPVYPLLLAPPLKTGRYPHMAKHDARIWERFLDVYGAQFQSVAYDVALGGFNLSEVLGSEQERQAWRYSTALKVDAIGLREQECWIIEVKPHAGTAALGACLAYAVMAELDGFTPLPLIPCVVTDYTSEDVRFCARQLGAVLIEVPEPAPAGELVRPPGFTVADEALPP
jgi:hypothetical protein